MSPKSLAHPSEPAGSSRAKGGWAPSGQSLGSSSVGLLGTFHKNPAAFPSLPLLGWPRQERQMRKPVITPRNLPLERKHGHHGIEKAFRKGNGLSANSIWLPPLEGQPAPTATGRDATRAGMQIRLQKKPQAESSEPWPSLALRAQSPSKQAGGPAEAW